MECARRMVVPNNVHASRKRPLLVRYDPIKISVWTHSSVGRFMNEASRRHCILAPTAKRRQNNNSTADLFCETYETSRPSLSLFRPRPQPIGLHSGHTRRVATP